MPDQPAKPEDLLPLTPAVFNILLALADGDKHGYGIMLEVEAATHGQVQMGPGTLYGSIKRMLKAGLIEESDERRDLELDDQRRRYYRVTGLGEGHCQGALAGAAARWRRTCSALPPNSTLRAGNDCCPVTLQISAHERKPFSRPRACFFSSGV